MESPRTMISWERDVAIPGDPPPLYTSGSLLCVPL